MSFGFGIGDLVALTNFLKNVVDACRSGPGQYRELHRELQSLQLALQPLERALRSQTPIPHGDSTITRGQALGQILVNCQIAVEEVQALINKHSSLQSDSHGGIARTWDSYRIGTMNLDSLRSRLALYASTINVLISTGIDAKIDRVYTRLCQNDAAKVQLSSAALMPSDHAMPAPNSSRLNDAWQLLRQELVKEGIAQDTLGEHRDEVLAYIKSLAQTQNAPVPTSQVTYASSQPYASAQTYAPWQPSPSSQQYSNPQTYTYSLPVKYTQPQTYSQQQSHFQPYWNSAPTSESGQYTPGWGEHQITAPQQSASPPKSTVYMSPPASSQDSIVDRLSSFTFLYKNSNYMDLKATKHGDGTFFSQAFYLHGTYNGKRSCFLGAEISLTSSAVQDLSSAEVLMTISSAAPGSSGGLEASCNTNNGSTCSAVICEMAPIESSTTNYVSDIRFIGHMTVKLLPTKAQKLKLFGDQPFLQKRDGTLVAGWTFTPDHQSQPTKYGDGRTRVGVIVHDWYAKFHFELEVRGTKKKLFAGSKGATFVGGGDIWPHWSDEKGPVQLTRNMLYGFVGHRPMYGKDVETNCGH